MSSNESYVTGLFPDRASAERAYQHAHDRGYDVKDVNMVMNDETRKRHFGAATEATELGNKAAEGASIGGAIGGTVGAVAAAIAAIGTSRVLPGIGLVVAGPIAAAFAGAGAGAAGGGLIGALGGWGIPEERIKKYDEGIKSGSILMGIKPRSADDAEVLENAWRSSNGTQIYR